MRAPIECEDYYSPESIDWILLAVFMFRTPNKSTKGVYYYDVPIAFDIETSSFISNRYSKLESGKCACMYEWTLGIDGFIIIGRTWEEFAQVVERIVTVLNLHKEFRIVCYVHNLAYEFQWIRKRFEWLEVFAVDNRRPLYATTVNGIEFRCSYLLSGYSLAKLGDELRTHKVKKMVGDLDYSLVRHSRTLLTKKEIGYCVNDVKVVLAYIEECLEDEGHIFSIPLTKTGYVRRYCRKLCLGGKSKTRTKEQWNYRDTIKRLTLEPSEYEQLKRCFQGGFTHANPFYSGTVMENVASYDFTSSYPTVMIAEEFPMGKSELIEELSKEQFSKYLESYCCMFDVEFFNIEATFLNDNYISSSHCFDLTGAQLNNGRVVRAESLLTTITEVDFKIIEKMYKWEYMDVRNFRIYPKDYLPTPFVKAILELYKTKTELKGVEGKEVEYLVAKGMLNSCYGMTVTDIGKDDVIYCNDMWDTRAVNLVKSMEDYNKNRGRFLFYPWGVWITAYARRNLFTGILECGNDYIYSDTDSLKIVNADKHLDYIQDYNDDICSKLEYALDYHGIPYEFYSPKSKDGVEHPLGVWDYEGTYSRFKTLGAKRYLVEENGKHKLTVAGLGKKDAMSYMERSGKDIFDFFSHGMYIPKGSTGKNIHTYIDFEQSGKVTDYFGIESEFEEKSAIYMEECDYSLSLSRSYVDYLIGIWQEKES